MRREKRGLLAARSAASILPVFAVFTFVGFVACNEENKPTAKTPHAESDAAASPLPAATVTPPTGATTTTTTALDGGDAMGTKLQPKDPKVRPSRSDEPGRTPKDLQALVAAHRDEARACYDKGLKDHTGIEGDLDVKFVIDPNGVVTEASVDTARSSILEPSVGDCVADVIKGMKFAPSAKGFQTTAHYPFNFHPKTFTPKDAGR